MDFGLWDYAIAILVAICVGLAKGGFNGMGLFAVLLMTAIFPAKESTGALLPMFITADIVAVILFWKYARMRLVVGLLPPAFVGIVVGWLLMPHIPGKDFGKMMGWLILALVILTIVRKMRPQWEIAIERKIFAWPLGAAAGVTTMVSNAAGPLMNVYLIAGKLPKMEFVATSAWFFFVVNVLKVPFSYHLGLISAKSLALNAVMIPLIIASVFLARWGVKKINQSAFDWLMIAFTVLAALRLVW